MPLISISDAQRAPLPHANFVATIHHGLPHSLHEASYRPRGRLSCLLGQDLAGKGAGRRGSDAAPVITTLIEPASLSSLCHCGRNFAMAS
jgi:hypothetical protein